MPPPNPSSTTLKRIHREIADVKKEDLGAIRLSPTEDDLFHWTATIPGPEGSVYEGGVFEVEIVLGHDYPFSAPRVTFRTRIYHMNINERGSICIDILKHNWSPALSLFKVILSLSSLLTDPNPKDPLVPTIATQYTRNRAQHDNEARRWTELYARPKVPPVNKGKSKASASPAPTAPTPRTTSAPLPTVSRRTPASGTETITIEDSENEDVPARSAQARRAKPSAGTGLKRKRAAISGEVDIDLSVEDGDVQRPPRRTRTEGASRTDPGEVIVIED